MIKFYNVPLLTAGAFAYDYIRPKTDKDSEFYLLTKTGYSFANVAESIYAFYNRSVSFIRV